MNEVEFCKHGVPSSPHLKCHICSGSDIDILKDKIDIYETALKQIEQNKCRGTYGPCGAADGSVSIAEDALEDAQKVENEMPKE